MKYFEETPSDMPGHYKIRDAYRFTTSDLVENDYFRFSRVVQNNYIPDHGILVQNGKQRIRFFTRLGIDLDEFIHELTSIMIEDTFTILHYCPAGYIDVVITGIQPRTFGDLPERFRTLYYDD